MRTFKELVWIAICLAAGFLVGTVAFSQEMECSNGVCRIVKYEWRKLNEDQLILYRGDKVVGQWYYPNDAYYPWDGSKVGDKCEVPSGAPKKEPRVSEDMAGWCQNGVCSSKLNSLPDPVLSHSGKQIHHSKVVEAFSDADEGQSKGYVVIITKDDSKRNDLLSAWNSLPPKFTSRYNIWAAPPNHFSLKDRFSGKPRFFTDGDPTVILQNSGGEVLFRRPQKGQIYKDVNFQDLLKSDPEYKPELDPGAPDKQPVSFGATAATSLTVGGLALLLMLRRKK